MISASVITLIIIGLAIVLFATEKIPVDLSAIIIMLLLVFTGVISAEEGVAGFSNKATITVAFMFILSEALLKSGALQVLTQRLSRKFKNNINVGLILMMILIAIISAFINNTPVVAMFIPVVIQLGHRAKVDPSKMLIPLSFASIFGGMCTLIGTSTNILVSGIAEKEGLASIGMFEMSKIGIILLVVGVLYMSFIGKKLLPERNQKTNFSPDENTRTYITQIQILENSSIIGQPIMETDLVKDLDIDVIEVRRGTTKIDQPAGDFVLFEGDLIKLRCDVEKIKALKDEVKIVVKDVIQIGDSNFKDKKTSIVELVITSNSPLIDKNLKQVDFRRRYRAIPLAIKHRDEIVNQDLYEVDIKAGDVILAEVKSHYLEQFKAYETQKNSPFLLLSEDLITSFDKKNFWIVLGLLFLMVTSASLGWIDIMIGAISCVAILALFKIMKMKEIYQSVNWSIVFLLACALSLGTAMTNTGLDLQIGEYIINYLGDWGVIAVISGLYLSTSLLTELMSNNASAALMAPIAIAVASSMGLDALPFLITIMIAASATFMTPIGYQTNTMVYASGNYKFKDFFKVGVGLNLIFWILTSFLVPYFYF
ncbi:MAG: SLC13 family permease [Flavobacteriaceae bacterium]|nr:SLC13 family permease [Flavobacteriaceae bacterium]